jgi:[ribosomal protein S18]-alanine N-acetyltransferase
MDLFGRFFGRAKLSIGALAPQHAPTIARLHGLSFAHGWDTPEVARMLSEHNILGDGVFAGSSTVPAGFVMTRLAADEAEILSICIDEAMRGQGLASRLMAHHVAGLAQRGAARLFLEVEAGNAPALALYRRSAFVQVGERPGYYPKPDGSRAMALILRRDIG